jgi:hypothetical protein
VRGAVFAVAVGPSAALALAAGGADAGTIVAFSVFLAGFVFVVGSGTCVELHAERFARSWQRDLLAAGIVTALTAVAVVVLVLQVPYTDAVIERRSVAEGLGRVGQALGGLEADGAVYAEAVLLLALPSGSFALGRLRGWDGARRAALTTVVLIAAALWPLLDAARMIGSDVDVREAIAFLGFLAWGVTGIAGACLPLADRLGQRLGVLPAAPTAPDEVR